LDLLLKNISWSVDGTLMTSDVRISKGIISAIGNLLQGKKKEKVKVLDFQDYFLYPGLINSHDHLEMNLYPIMGNPPYNNYTQWASDIYKPKESPVKEIQRIAIKDRLMWGGIKNLISGVTTAVHHNPWNRLLSQKKFPVHVEETAWAHSLAFEKNIQRRFQKKRGKAFVVHAGEGVDFFAEQEIARLHSLGLLKENTVLVHAVAMSERNQKLIQEANASIVWCPSSNLFMFNQTAPVNQLKNKTRVAIGSDSTMTGPATLLEEMRVALKTRMATAEEIYAMVTSIPAQIFGLPLPEIKIGSRANLLIAPKQNENYFENILSLSPSDISAVFVNGELRYGALFVATSLGLKGYSLPVLGRQKWINYDVSTLKKKIALKAKDSCAENSLWKMLS
jgi:cytosine/adenosine deaminase-related metal-dependent hydrolase